MGHASKTKELPIPLRGTGQAGLQKEIQAHCVGNGLERPVPDADLAGYAVSVHPVLRTKHSTLYNLPILREPSVRLL